MKQNCLFTVNIFLTGIQVVVIHVHKICTADMHVLSYIPLVSRCTTDGAFFSAELFYYLKLKLTSDNHNIMQIGLLVIPF